MLRALPGAEVYSAVMDHRITVVSLRTSPQPFMRHRPTGRVSIVPTYPRPHRGVFIVAGVALLLAALLGFAAPTAARAMAETGAIVVGGEPKYLLPDASGGRLFVSNFTGDEVAVVDLATGLVVRRLPAPGSPVGLALSPQGLYVAAYYGNTVTLLDPDTGAVRARRDLGAGGQGEKAEPWDLKLVDGPAGRRLLAVTEHHGDAVTFLDAATLQQVARILTGYFPYQMDVDEAAHVLYVAVYGGARTDTNHGGGQVAAIDLHTLTAMWTSDTGQGSFDVVVDPAAGRVFVSDFVGSTFSRVGADGLGLTQRKLSGKAKGAELSSDGTELWLALQTTDSVVGVDPLLGTLKDIVAVGSLPGPEAWLQGAVGSGSTGGPDSTDALGATGGLGSTDAPILLVGNQGDGTVSLLSDGPPVPEFEDIPRSHPLHREIRALALRGAIGGYDLGGGRFEFRPDSGLMRAQIAKMLVGALALHTPGIETAGALVFADVPPDTGTYPYDYVQEAARLGLVKGFVTDPPVFKPYTPVTRIQLLRMAVRAAEAMGSPLAVPAGASPFRDIGSSDPDLEIVKAAYGAGMVSGVQGADGYLRLKPYDPADRGETAHVLFALLRSLGG